jgi:transcriptional regulator with XRE-family HTH domain
MMKVNYFKNKLGEYMKEKGVSQLELYKMTGISPAAISNIVNGKQIPYPGWCKRICEALNSTDKELWPDLVDDKKEG